MKGDALEGDKTRMLALLEWIARSPTGPPKNDEISHIIDREKGIWQFAKGSVRALWFYDSGRLIVLTHGFMKTTQKTPDAELERARKALREYLTDQKAGKIHLVEEDDG